MPISLGNFSNMDYCLIIIKCKLVGTTTNSEVAWSLRIIRLIIMEYYKTLLMNYERWWDVELWIMHVLCWSNGGSQ